MKLLPRPAAAVVAAIAITMGSVTALVAGAGPASAADAGSTYVPLSPGRVLDTRTGLGQGGVAGSIVGGTTIDLKVTGAAGVPATGVDAVALNVTAVNGTASASYLTVFPTGSPRPLASNLNFPATRAVPNMVMARVGTDGKISIYNSAGTAHVIADVQGWYAATANPVGGRYSPLEPSRVLDTRFGIGAAGAVVGGTAIDLIVNGRGGVPFTGVGAVVLNVTATGVSGPDTFVTVYPSGTARPHASNLNAVAGQTVPNLVVAQVNNGRVSLYNHSGLVHLIADVQGWYSTPSEPAAGKSTYTPVSPVRSLDTRDGTGIGVAGKLGPGALTLQLTGRNGVPATGVTAVVLNVTVTEPTGPDSFLTVYPSLTSRPLASNLNYSAGQTIANLVIARVGTNGAVTIYNNLGAVHVVADVQGWFTAST